MPGPSSATVLLAGATAVGKSAIAMQLTDILNGELVSVDSMQVYRGLDIGTAKPSPAERARVPHHLIDVADLSEWFDAARFVHLAGEAVAGIRGRGRVPILCGGTGLYFKAFLEGLGSAPAGDPAIRAELRSRPMAELLEELERTDPKTFQHVDRQNPRRVIRALEVIRLTGRPFSDQRADWGQALRSEANYFVLVGLARSSPDLRLRIEARVDEMFRHGLVAETEQLLERGLDRNLAAMQALGYRQVVEHLRGERSLPNTIELVKNRTRRFAKRQMTWFRKQLSFRWFQVAPDEAAQTVAERLCRELGLSR